MSDTRVARFALCDLEEQVAAFASRWPSAAADDAGTQFVAPDGRARLHLPLAGPRAEAGQWIAAYAERLPADAERQIVLLLRAGAMAIGYWAGDELLHHKAQRRYVVRGSGKAQATHLKTRGKSRYGSRLRLQNWRRLLAETIERVHDCVLDHGEVDRLFYSAPVRIWSEVLAAEPSLPLDRQDPRLQRVPMHVHRPDHEELLRVRRWLVHGRLELPA